MRIHDVLRQLCCIAALVSAPLHAAVTEQAAELVTGRVR